MGATTIAATHGSRANRAGSFFERQSAYDQAAKCLSAISKEIRGDTYSKRPFDIYEALRNTRGNRDNGTKQSAGISEKSRNLLPVTWTRWLNCANTLQRRQRYSISAQRNLRCGGGQLR